MIEEAIKAIQEMAVEASGAKGKAVELPLEREPGHVYAIVNKSGEIDIRSAVPKPRAHKLGGIAEVCPYVEERGDADSVVWYDEKKIEIVMDDATRRDRVVCDLTFTPQFRLIQELQNAKYFDQKSFVRMLRVDLADCLLDNRLLEFVRGLKFTATATTAGTVRHGRESIGRDVEMQLQGASMDECPETTVLQCRMFTDTSLRDSFQVNCAVEIDMDAQRFALTPFPMECRNAIDSQLNRIQEMLQVGLEAVASEHEEDGYTTPLFRGSP